MLTEGFNLLHRATSTIRRENADRAITVSATPALALRWLAPALDRLRHEGIAEFRIDASSRQADLFAGEADLDIRYGRTVEEGLVADVLFSECVFPVCNPDYAAKHNLREAQDLLGAELLFVDDWAHRGGVWSAWQDWFEVATRAPHRLQEAVRFSEMDKAVEAAANGRGVAIGAARHLSLWKQAKLIRPFDEELEVRYSSVLVALPEIAEERTIRRLRRRLVALAAENPNVLHQGAF
jgi:LysR family glycine cleavage system transcriptional activator